MDVLKLLDLVEDIIEEGSNIPFSSKVCIDKDEILDIMNEIRLKLPDEIKQAEWIKEERQRILAEAQNEAETVTQEARSRIEEMIEDDELTERAKERAEEIVEQAQKHAKEIRIGAREYTDQLLKDVQEQLKGIIGTLDDNRQELKGLK